MKTNKFNKNIINKLKSDLDTLFTNIDNDYTIIENTPDKVCEAIMHTSDVTGYDILSELENVDLINEVQDCFDCEVEQLVIFNNNDNFYMISKVYFNNKDYPNYILKRLDKFNTDKYITTNDIITCKTKELLEIKCLTVATVVSLVSKYMVVDFNEAIRCFNEEYLDQVFNSATEDILTKRISYLALNGLNGLNSNISEFSINKFLDDNRSEITWVAIMVSINMIKETLESSDSITKALDKAYNIEISKKNKEKIS